jgi:secreted trypsin-like serine protease
MKHMIKYIVLTVLAVVMLGGAAVAFAQTDTPEGFGRGPHGPGGRGGGGEVTEIDGNNIIAENPREQVTIVTTADTQFTVNGESGSLSDIQVGMFVGARGERSDDGTVTAEEVFAGDERPERPDGDRGLKRGAGGEVTEIDGNNIIAENPREQVTIVTTADTQFTVNGESGSLSDIQVGMFVGARGERSDDGTVTAEEVFAGDERPERPDGDRGLKRGAGGEVTEIDGNNIIAENPREQVTIVTTADTQFTVNGESGSLSDIQVGMFVGARGERSDDGTVTAEEVFAGDERPERPDGDRGLKRGAGGEVTEIDGNNIIAENPREQVTIVTTADTQFTVNGESGSLSDIQVGMFVGARGERSDDGTVTAEEVFASDEQPEKTSGAS